MPSRRAHTKSRNGCAECKRARVKCDQHLPACFRCSKKDIPCSLNDAVSWPAPLENGLSSNPQPPATSSNSTNSTVASPGPLITAAMHDFDPGDLILMHHYSTSTYRTLAGDNPDVMRVWQVDAPQEAYHHPCLMHSLLALAALHLSETGTVHRAAAIKHHELALAHSKTALSNVTEQNSWALFVFSGAIVILALALPITPTDREMDDPIGQLIQVANLIRGSGTLVRTELLPPRPGSLSLLIRRDFLSSSFDVEEKTASALVLLQGCARKITTDGEALASYNKAIDALRTCYKNIVPDPEDRQVVLCWVALVDEHFLELLSSRDKMALTILAYYGALLHNLRACWWCRGWGYQIVKRVSGLSGERWHELLEWPQRVVGIGAVL